MALTGELLLEMEPIRTSKLRGLEMFDAKKRISATINEVIKCYEVRHISSVKSVASGRAHIIAEGARCKRNRDLAFSSKYILLKPHTGQKAP